jgi:molecular chaperone GrpE
MENIDTNKVTINYDDQPTDVISKLNLSEFGITISEIEENDGSVSFNINSDISDRLKESEDKYLRLFADFENYKKRVIKDKQDIVINTKNNMLSSILDIDNDLSIAMKSVSDEVKDGILIISKKLDVFLKSQNVETIQTDKYDEDLHDVIGLNSKDNTNIFAVVSKGYTIDNKVVRHPKIILGT